jgi:outer membrane protein assembly factor BamB
LPIFVVFPASFLFWRLKGNSWGTRCLLALAALLAVSLTYWVLPIALTFTRAFMLTVPLYVIAVAVTSKAWTIQNVAAGILWAGLAAYLRSPMADDASSDRLGRRFSPLLPVLVCAVPALAGAFSLDIHHRHVEARIEAEKVERGKQMMQKLDAMVKWRLVLPRDVPSSLAIVQPPLVGPDGSAYLVARKESRLHAVDSSGNLKWSFSGVIAADPAVSADGTVYVVGMAHTLHALDAGSGQMRWSTQFSDGLDQICTGPALAADGTVYILTQRNPFSLRLNAVTPEGKLRWQVAEPSEKMCSTHDVPEMAPQLLPSPIVGRDGTIFFTNDGVLHAVEPRGSNKWSAPTERPIAKMLLGKQGQVYTYAQQLAAFDANGQLQWTSPWHTALYLHPDIGEDGTIYLVESTGSGQKLVAVNPDGSEKWTFASDSAVQAVLASPDGKMYISAGNGALYALDAERHKLDWGYTSTIQACAPVMAPDGEFFALHQPNQVSRQGALTSP